MSSVLAQINYNKQGVYESTFIGNPQMSFFKVVYRKYTNFSMTQKEIKLLNGSGLLQDTNDTKLTFELMRGADNASILKDLYFTFELPDIYSGKSQDGVNGCPYEFKWIENIGSRIINDDEGISLMLNNEPINRYTGEYMHIMSELKYDETQKKVYNSMIGNVPELYNPENNTDVTYVAVVLNGGSNYSDGYYKDLYSGAEYRLYTDAGVITDVVIYKEGADFYDNKTISVEPGTNLISIDSGTEKMRATNADILHVDTADPAPSGGQILLLKSDYPHIRSSVNNQYQTVYPSYSNTTSNYRVATNNTTNRANFTNFIPSIKKRKIKVPLNFFMSKNTGLGIPLCSLQKTLVHIEVNLRKLRDLYTITKLVSNNTLAARQVPDTDINLFLNNSLNGLDIKPKIEATFIYLDIKEHDYLCSLSNQEFLIEDMKFHNNIETNQNDSMNVRLGQYNGAVKEMIVVSQRSDMKSINNWSNYTNWPIENVSPYSREYIKQRSYYNSNLSQFIFFNKNDLIDPTPTNDSDIKFEMKYFKESIIDEMGIIFGPGNRIKQDGDFFNKLQAYEHHKKQIKNGMYIYSFSLHPNELQPSGFCDFSNIDNIELSVKTGNTGNSNTKSIPDDATGSPQYSYEIKVYLVTYNILSISGGLGYKKFSD
jgi:hypothetical protein